MPGRCGALGSSVAPGGADADVDEISSALERSDLLGDGGMKCRGGSARLGSAARKTPLLHASAAGKQATPKTSAGASGRVSTFDVGKCGSQSSVFTQEDLDYSTGGGLYDSHGRSSGYRDDSLSNLNHCSRGGSGHEGSNGASGGHDRDDVSETFDCNLSESEDGDSYVPGGYHPVKVGKVYDDRYRVEGKLGWGYFSTVWLATDLKTKPLSFVAIKFQRSAPNHTEAVCDEISLLKKVRDQVICRPWLRTKKQYKDALGDLYNSTRGVVSFLNWFKVKGPNGTHICVVLEPMGPNLLSLIKMYKFKGVPIPLVRKITAHVLLGLDYLHRVCGIIHTDLKPENILVTSKLCGCSPLEHPRDGAGGDAGSGPYRLLEVPYVKSEIKPRRSDPTCLTSFDDVHALQETLIRKPYDLIPDKILEPLRDVHAKVADPGMYHPAVAQVLGLKPSIVGLKKRPIIVKTQQGDMQLKPVDTTFFDRPEAVFKICDLGNACWIDRHFTDEIQTRQYRAPEAILGCGYDQSSDLWSLACIVFELITGDYLFDPHGNNGQERDINHLQLIVELLGPIPRNMLKASAKFKHLEREINEVKPWPLESVLVRKYKLPVEEAKQLAEFLLCILKANPKERLPADMLLHSRWLHGVQAKS